MSAVTDRHGRTKPPSQASAIVRTGFLVDGLFHERRQRARGRPPLPPPAGWKVLLRWLAPSLPVSAVIACGWMLQAYRGGMGVAVTLLAVVALLVAVPALGRSPALIVLALVGTGFLLSLATWTGGGVAKDYLLATRGKEVPAVVTGLNTCALHEIKGSGLCSYSVASVPGRRPLGTIATRYGRAADRVGDRVTVVTLDGNPRFTRRPGQGAPGLDITFGSLAGVVFGELGVAALTWRGRRRRAYAEWSKEQAVAVPQGAAS